MDTAVCSDDRSTTLRGDSYNESTISTNIENDYIHVYLNSTVDQITKLVHLIGRQTFPQLNHALKRCDDIIDTLKRSDNMDNSDILSRSVSDVENSFGELTTSLCNLNNSINELKTMIPILTTSFCNESPNHLIHSFTISSESELSPIIKPNRKMSDREDINELISTLQFEERCDSVSMDGSFCSDSSLNSDYDPVGPSDEELIPDRQVIFIEGSVSNDNQLLLSQLLNEYFDKDMSESVRIINSQNVDELINTEESDSFIIVNDDG
jgi:flagellin-specific chaperone FliS